MTNPSHDAESDEPSVARHETRAALVQLLLIIAAALFASLVTGVTKTVFVLLAIVIMVMVHEFGHFVTAKWSGMKVTEYFLGFGPRVWSFKKGETEYGIRAIPAGGFVKVIGMNNLEHVDPSEEDRAFRSSPYWRRVVMASAGSFMHFVMAFFLSIAILGVVGVPKEGTTTIGEIIDMKTTSPARAAGLQEGDKFLAINGEKVERWEDVSTRLSAATVGQPVQVTVDRNGQTMNFALTPVDRRTAVMSNGEPVDDPGSAPAASAGFIGVQAKAKYVREGLVRSFTQSGVNVGNGVVQVVKALGERFSPSGLKLYYDNVVGHVPASQQVQADQGRFVSAVGLVGFANDAARSGWFAVLTLLFSINLFIGVFNMIPLLPFDGGHVAVAIYEKIRSIKRPRYHADYAKLVPVSYAVLLVMVLITASSLWLDIVKPLPNQFK